MQLAFKDNDLYISSLKHSLFIPIEIGKSWNNPHHTAYLLGSRLPQGRLAPMILVGAILLPAIFGILALVFAHHMDLSIINAMLKITLNPFQQRLAIDFPAIQGLGEHLNRPIKR